MSRCDKAGLHQTLERGSWPYIPAPFHDNLASFLCRIPFSFPFLRASQAMILENPTSLPISIESWELLSKFALISCLCLAKLPSNNTWTSKAVSYHEEQKLAQYLTGKNHVWAVLVLLSTRQWPKAALQILRIRVNSLYSQLSALFSASKRTTKRVFLVQKIKRALQALTKLTFILQLRHKNGSITETSPKRNTRRDKLH